MTLQLRHNVQSAASKPPKKRRKVIDVEQYVAADEHEVSIWMETKHFTLLQEDCEILLNPCGWLNSSLIAAAQILMKERYEGVAGLQDPCYGQCMVFKVVASGFVQILHNGKNHWLTVTNIGVQGAAEVLVYDSLYTSINTSVQTQIAALLRTTNKEITVNIMEMQLQAGTCDCGLFAIATAMCLLTGNHPGGFLFKQADMRKHLYECLKNGRMMPFPLLKRRRASLKVKYTEALPVYCSCRLPELPGEDMVQCSGCNEWYHVDCLGQKVPKVCLEESQVDWYCDCCL